MKNKIVVFGLLIAGMLNAKTLSFDESIDVFTKNNLNIKNISIDENIREVNKKELINGIDKNMGVSAKTSYALEKLGMETKITYKDAYVSLKNTDISKEDLSFSVGYEKKINEFLYNTDKVTIYKNSLENENSENSEKTQIKNLIKSFGEKYISLLNTENSLKAKLNLLEQKKKDYEIASIKEKNQTINANEIKVIRLNIEKLETEIKILETEKEYKVKEFNNLLGIDEEISIKDLDEVKTFEFFNDNSTVEEIENSLLIAQEELEGLKLNKLPDLTGSLAYDLTKEDISASLNLTWYPLDYNGEEKAKELNIEKLKNQLEDEKNAKLLKETEEKNSVLKEELNLTLSEKDVEIAKAELDKYTTMKNLGTVSEYDYYSKQKEVTDKEIIYLNLKNSLNLNKKLQIIYNKL